MRSSGSHVGRLQNMTYCMMEGYGYYLTPKSGSPLNTVIKLRVTTTPYACTGFYLQGVYQEYTSMAYTWDNP